MLFMNLFHVLFVLFRLCFLLFVFLCDCLFPSFGQCLGFRLFLFFLLFLIFLFLFLILSRLSLLLCFRTLGLNCRVFAFRLFIRTFLVPLFVLTARTHLR